jgi:predicted GH43/DUF377 family glycosyl hydrolase
MKRNAVIFFLSIILFLVGCSKTNNLVNSTTNSTGDVSFKFDPHSIPTGITLITANLTRTGFTEITKNLNLLTDTTAEVIIPAVQVGTWHLVVEALDNNSTVLYRGETDVTVQGNVVVQLNLTLNPVSSGTGTISIFVTWGTNPSDQWIDFSGNPILKGNNNPSLPNEVRYGKVIQDNGLYKMWYCSVYDGGVGNIWYAESQNGISWNTIGSNPVLYPGNSGSWDSHFVVPAVVIKVNSLYKMFYLGGPVNFSPLSVGLATSIDGIHWDKYNTPVLTPNNQYNSIGLTDIVVKDSVYNGYFNYTTPNSSVTKIGLVTSLNGINWTFYSGNPVLSPTLLWEGGNIANPTIIYSNNQFKLVYENSGQNAFGMATSSDGFTFVKKALPIFKITDAEIKLAQISYPYYRKFDDVSFIYYTGETGYGGYLCLARNFNDIQ